MNQNIMFDPEDPNADKREYFSRIKKNYLEGKIPNLRSFWYDSWESIEDSKLEDWAKPDQSREVILFNINLKKLISRLEPRYHSIFKYHMMFNPRRSDDRTSSILDAWMNEIPLLPPSLMFNGENFILISDGIHRVNAAYCLGELKIPVIVNAKELVEYGWDLLDEIGDIKMAIKKP